MRRFVIVCVCAGCGDLSQATVRDVDLSGAPSDLGAAADLAQANDLSSGAPVVDVSGTIAVDTTWSGNYRITGDLVIAAGKTLTVAAGSLMTAAPNVGLFVDGALTVGGTPAAPVRFTAATAMQHWGGITVRGGAVDLANAVVEWAKFPLVCDTGTSKCLADRSAFTHYTGNGILLRANASFTRILVENGGASNGIFCNTPGVSVTISDSVMHATGGDAVWFENGSLTLDHSSVYGNTIGGDGAQHCAGHFGGGGTFLVHTTDFYRSVYGLMASALSSTSQITGNNFYENTTSWGPSQATAGGAPIGVNPAAQLGGNYWGGKVPSVSGNSTVKPSDPSTYSATKLAGTGPRP